MSEPARDVTVGGGRTVRVREAGAPDGPVVVAHHGTPGAGVLFRTEVDHAQRLRIRLVAYDRPGYGGSAPQPDRTIADAAGDVAAVLDALGADRFATYGVSGGGPHALACAALLPERCAAAATVAGVGPFDAPDLDWLAGMGEGNIAEFGAAREGRQALTAFCTADAQALLSVGPDQLAEAMRPHVSDVDARALTGELAAHLVRAIRTALEPGVDGWVDDDLAFLAPWGFDVASVGVPVLVWQGEQDLMVPADHGRWLAGHVAGAEGDVFAQEGHFTLAVNRIGDVQAWLAERLGAAA